MSLSGRLRYIVLLGMGLLIAWLGIDRLTASPLVSPVGLLLVIAALVIFGGLSGRVPHILAANDSPALNTPMSRLDRLIQAVLERRTMLLGIIMGVGAVTAVPIRWLQPPLALLVWAVWVAVFLVWAAHMQPRRTMQSATQGLWTWAGPRYLELTVVALLIIGGGVLRGVGLEMIPHNIHGDEGGMGFTARAILSGDRPDPFSTSWLSHPTLWFYLQALSLTVFGDTLGGLRALSAILGTLALLAVYLFVRPLYTRATAVLTTALLAAYHVHVHYSRIALNNIADPLMMTLTLAAVMHGYRTRAPFSFAGAGVLMGLAQYFYFGTRLIPVIVIQLLIYLALWHRRELLVMKHQVGLMFLGFLITAGPLIHYFSVRPDTFNARLAEHGLLQNNNLARLAPNGQPLFTALIDHAYRAVGLFFFTADTISFYGPEIPLLDQFSAVLFLFGTAIVLVRWRQVESAALLLWVGNTALFGGFLLFDPPQSTRYLIAVPGLCVLIVMALLQITALLQHVLRVSQRTCMRLVALIVVVLLLWNISFYFGVYIPRNSYARTSAMTELAYYLRNRTRKDYVYMFTSPYFYLNHGTIGFIANSPSGIDMNDQLHSIAFLPTAPTGQTPLFIFVPERLNELEIVKQRYPLGQLHEIRMPPSDDRPILYVYEPH